MNNQTVILDNKIALLRETVRQICHPVNGLSKSFFPPPILIGDWKKCLDSTYGWVNIGIEQNIASVLYELKIGEVIPDNSANMDIYTFGFSTVEIGKLLNFGESEKNYKVIINYYSFLRLIDILRNGQDKEYCLKFNTSLNTIFKDINPSTFWLNFIISEETAQYLKNNNIGEVIVKEGSRKDNAMLKSKFEKKEPAIWKNIYNDIDEEVDRYSEEFENNEDDEDDENNETYSDKYEQNDVSDNEKKEDFNDKTENNMEDDIKRYNEPDAPYRLIMNNVTLLKLILYSCTISNNINDNTNVYELMGGDDGDFTSLFGNLQF